MEIFIRGLVALGIALAVAAYGFSDVVQAPLPDGVAAAPAAGNGNADSGYGWAPRVKHVFGHSHSSCGCGSSGSGHFGGHFGGHGQVAAPAPQSARVPPPRTQPGTVVFPQHPFARGPRDFFMAD